MHERLSGKVPEQRLKEIEEEEAKALERLLPTFKEHWEMDEPSGNRRCVDKPGVGDSSVGGTRRALSPHASLFPSVFPLNCVTATGEGGRGKERK